MYRRMLIAALALSFVLALDHHALADEGDPHIVRFACDPVPCVPCPTTLSSGSSLLSRGHR